VNRQTLISLDGWAETSVDKFINETKRIKNSLSYAQFLHATGWFGELGEKTLQKIIDNDGWNLGVQDLIQIDGVQEKIASMFIKGKCTYYMYENFLKEFSFVYEKSIILNKEGKLSGFHICMTGFRDKDLSQQIQELGGNVSDNINKQTNCLITKDKNSTSSKILKAQKLGITIYNIDEFKNEYIL
jgi:NAD-dependent DNA ligase